MGINSAITALMSQLGGGARAPPRPRDRSAPPPHPRFTRYTLGLTRRPARAGISQEALFGWAATAWVVCVGAPLGALLIRPTFVPYLRALFYLIAIVQART
jgi:hypothetical protein